jgi:MFS family permease
MDHHNHDFWWRYFPHKELTQMYFSAAMRSFAISLIALFVPLYLYIERGFSLNQTLQFFIFYAVMFAATTPLAAKFCSKYGLKHSILLSVPLYITFILLLYLLPVINTPLPIIASFLAFSLSFYWMGMHMAFYHISDHKHRGEEVGKRTSVSIIANMFGPLIGGFLIKFVGFKIVFVLASLVLLGAALFLFLSKEDYVKYHFSLRTLFDRKHWEYPLVFIARGMRAISAGILWPLFIFAILNDYLTLGFVGFILSALSALLVWIIGKFSDHQSKRKIIQWVAGFESLSWFLRAFVASVGQVIGISIFGGITYGAMESPLGALEYDNANKNNVAAYFVGREIYICLGRILILSFVIMIDNLAGGFILNGFANLLVLLF